MISSIIQFYVDEMVWFNCCYISYSKERLKTILQTIQTKKKRTSYKATKQRQWNLIIKSFTCRTCMHCLHGKSRRDFWTATWRHTRVEFHPTPSVLTPCSQAAVSWPMVHYPAHGQQYSSHVNQSTKRISTAYHAKHKNWHYTSLFAKYCRQ